jgi:hypothetical protein
MLFSNSVWLERTEMAFGGPPNGVEMHYGKQNQQFNPAAVNLTGTA